MRAKGLRAPGGLVEPTSDGRSSAAGPRPVCKPPLRGVDMRQHLSFLSFGKAAGGFARVKTTLGKTDRVGS